MAPYASEPACAAFLLLSRTCFQGEKCITHLHRDSIRQQQPSRKQQHLFVFNIERPFCARNRSLGERHLTRADAMFSVHASGSRYQMDFTLFSRFIWFYSALPMSFLSSLVVSIYPDNITILLLKSRVQYLSIYCCLDRTENWKDRPCRAS